MKIEIEVVRSERTTFGSLYVGQAFKWAEPRDDGDVYCLKVRSVELGAHAGWMPLSGRSVGTIYKAYDADKVRDVS